MRIFVTGGTGYVGSHIVRRLLADKHELTLLTRSKQIALADQSISIACGDITNPDSYNAFLQVHDALIHAAIHWENKDDEHGLVDRGASAQLFEAAAHAGIGHLIYVSSTAVHRPFKPLMSEETELAPIEDYGITKSASESALIDTANRHAIKWNVVRLAPTVGASAYPGGPFKTDRLFEEFSRLAKSGEDVCVAKNDGRQFIAANDAGRLFAALIDTSKSGIYLAAARNFTTWDSIADQTVKSINSNSKVIVEDTGLPPNPYIFDVSKIKQDLGFEFDSTDALTDHVQYLASL